jgi:hypothetical protein
MRMSMTVGIRPEDYEEEEGEPTEALEVGISRVKPPYF